MKAESFEKIKEVRNKESCGDKMETEFKSKLENERYGIEMDQLGAAVIEWNFETGSFYSSAAFKKFALSAIDPDIILQSNFPIDIIHPDDRKKFQKLKTELEAGKDSVTVVLRMKMTNGQIHWCRITCINFKDDDGKIYRIITVIIDINDEHKKSFMLDTLLNDMPGGVTIFACPSNPKILYFSDGFAKMYGETRAEMQAKIDAKSTLLKSIAAPDKERYRAETEQAIAQKRNIDITFRILKKDGQISWTHMIGNYMGEENGSPIYYCIFASPTDESSLFESIVRDATIAVFVGERNSRRVIYANKKFMELFDISPQVLKTGDSIFQILPDHKKPLLTQEQINSLSYDSYTEFIIERPDFYLVLNARAILWNGIEAYVFYISDETAEHLRQIEIQKKVQAEQERLQRLYDEQVSYTQMISKMSLASSMVNLTKNYISLQDTEQDDIMAIITKQTPQEGFESMYPHIPDEEIRKQYAAVFNSETIIREFENGITEKVVRHPYNTYDNWLESGYIAVRNPKTNDIEVYCYANDVSKEVLQNDVAIALMSDEYEDVTLIHPCDAKITILKGNKDCMIYTEFDENTTYEEPLAMFINNYSADDDKASVIESLRLNKVIKALQVKRTYSVSFSIYNTEKKIRHKRMNFSYLNKYRSEILCSTQDISSDFENEHAQRELLQNALEQAKIAAKSKSDFLSQMSHDLRTPMNGILGLASLSKDETDIEALKNNISQIEASGQYLLSLINDTLDYQRIESGKMTLEPQIMDTSILVQEILNIVKSSAEKKNITFKLNNHNVELNWKIRIDQVRIKQILINLLSNSIKFTPEGGTVEFGFKLIKREGMIFHSQITVTDTGIGMSEDFIKNKIFQPFSQEKNEVTSNYAGSGLGLSIVKSLVELMGGSISVESELGVGTKFTIDLDFERIDAQEAETLIKNDDDSLETLKLVLNGKQILMAEDHPLNADISTRILNKVGCIVTWAKNGEDCVKKFAASKQGLFDAILMDIRMPIMDGLKTTAVIRDMERTDAKTIPIIAMTANAYEEDIEKSIAAGMDAHIAKPIEPNKLYSSLAEEIAKH